MFTACMSLLLVLANGRCIKFVHECVRKGNDDIVSSYYYIRTTALHCKCPGSRGSSTAVCQTLLLENDEGCMLWKSLHGFLESCATCLLDTILSSC